MPAPNYTKQGRATATLAFFSGTALVTVQGWYEDFGIGRMNLAFRIRDQVADHQYLGYQEQGEVDGDCELLREASLYLTMSIQGGASAGASMEVSDLRMFARHTDIQNSCESSMSYEKEYDYGQYPN